MKALRKAKKGIYIMVLTTYFIFENLVKITTLTATRMTGIELLQFIAWILAIDKPIENRECHTLIHYRAYRLDCYFE